MGADDLVLSGPPPAEPASGCWQYSRGSDSRSRPFIPSVYHCSPSPSSLPVRPRRTAARRRTGLPRLAFRELALVTGSWAAFWLDVRALE